jgi:hypothetical protein
VIFILRAYSSCLSTYVFGNRAEFGPIYRKTGLAAVTLPQLRDAVVGPKNENQHTAVGVQLQRIQKEMLRVKPLTLETNGCYVEPDTFDKPEWHVYIQGRR